MKQLIYKKNNRLSRIITSIQSNHNWLYVVFYLIYIVFGVILVLDMYSGDMKQTRSDNVIYTEATRDVAINKVIKEANQTDQISKQSADYIYADAIKKTDDNYIKSILSIARGTIYYNNQEYSKALSFAAESIDYDKNASSFAFVGQVYEKIAMYKDAIKNYRIAIVLLDKNKPAYYDDLDYYNYKISTLEKSL